MPFVDELRDLLELDHMESADYIAESIIANEYTAMTQKSKAFASRGMKVLIHHCSHQLDFSYDADYLKATHAIWIMTPDHPVEGFNSFKDMVSDVIEKKLNEKLGVTATCRLDLLSLHRDGEKLIATPINKDPIYEESIMYQAAIKLDWCEGDE